MVLLSGGLDSATVLAMARDRGLECHALSVAYGQRHHVELDAAARDRAQPRRARTSRHAGGSRAHRRLGAHRSSHRGARPSRGEGIPVTYVPARNTIMLSLALAWAEVLEAARDPHRRECRGLFGLSGLPSASSSRAFEQLAHACDQGGRGGRALAIHAPLIQMSKAQIVREGVVWAWTIR